MRRAIVIGAGFGGLTAAVRLAAKGWQVTIIEAQAKVGGKLQRITEGGYTFDRGASTITMPWVFQDVYRACGVNPDDYVRFYRVDPGAVNVFADGHRVALSSSVDELEEQIAAYSPGDAKQLRAFLARAAALYRISEEQFLHKLLLGWKEKASPKMLRAMWTIKPWQTVQGLLEQYFQHPNTLQLFGRYATYVGSDPRRTPAVFAMMAHLEQQLGVWAADGGSYALVRGLERLARELGVTIRTATRVERIVVEGGHATGVQVRELSQTCGLRHAQETELLTADAVIANADALTVYRSLVEPADRPSMSDGTIARFEPSLSGFVLLLGVRRVFPSLSHHNVFFPADYAAEFEAIFGRKAAPGDPTIYVCWNGYSESNHAPEGGSNLFVLVNAPYNNAGWDWNAEGAAYRDLVIRLLERQLGPFAADIEVEQRYHPGMLEADTGAHRGAIYGISSNSLGQAFFRPANRARDIPNLWFAGGSTHPGGGTPIVTLSGGLVADAVDRYTKGGGAS